MRITEAVPAVIPLSLLEALRNLDTPVEDGLDELAEEIVVRRLGLSPTVAAQIQRYRQAVERAEGIPLEEVVSVIRLVSRRPDSALVFADAGRRAARYAARSRGRSSAAAFLGTSPGSVGQRLALRGARRVARTVFGGDLRPRAEPAEFRMEFPLSIHAAPDGAACAFYGAAYAELLRSLAGFEGALLHERCRSRGDDVCLWRTAAAAVYE